MRIWGKLQGTTVVMSFLFTALLLEQAVFKGPQSWSFNSTALLGALKLSPSLIRQALAQGLGQAGDTLVTSPQQMRLKVTPPNLPIMNWNMARMSYMLDVLLERHPIT